MGYVSFREGIGWFQTWLYSMHLQLTVCLKSVKGACAAWIEYQNPTAKNNSNAGPCFLGRVAASGRKTTQKDFADYRYKWCTLPKTNIAPKNGWLEYKPFLLGESYFQGRTFSFREGIQSNFQSYEKRKVSSKGVFIHESKSCTLAIPAWPAGRNPVTLQLQSTFFSCQIVPSWTKNKRLSSNWPSWGFTLKKTHWYRALPMFSRIQVQHLLQLDQSVFLKPKLGKNIEYRFIHVIHVCTYTPVVPRKSMSKLVSKVHMFSFPGLFF